MPVFSSYELVTVKFFRNLSRLKTYRINNCFKLISHIASRKDVTRNRMLLDSHKAKCILARKEVTYRKKFICTSFLKDNS